MSPALDTFAQLGAALVLALVGACLLPRAWRRLGSPRLNWRALARRTNRG